MNLTLTCRLGLLTSTAISFSPASLFAAGEQGVWYDPSDFSTMFQESTGITPVTAAGQSVGFLGDKSQGFELGPELVTNGTFDAGIAGWTSGGGISWAAGRLSINAANETAFSPAFALPSGRTVVVTFDYTVLAGDALFVHFRNSSNAKADLDTNVSSGGSGTFRRIVRTTQAIEKISFQKTGTTGAATIDNISVRELAGNHATQSNASLRPILGRVPFGGRRNLLTFTQEFDNAAWSKQDATVTANSTTAPDGTSTADKLVDTTSNTTHYVTRPMTLGAGVFTFSAYLKRAELSSANLWFNATTSGIAYFNLADGTVSVTTGTIVDSATITSVGNGWYRCSITTNSLTAGTFFPVIGTGNPATYIGDGTSGIYVWGAQLEVGSTATAYQRVTDRWNVTEAGVTPCYYLAFDGTDDFLQTGTITPGIDKAQVFAGVRKLSDAAQGLLVESSASSASNNGTVTLLAPDTPNDYAWASKGTTRVFPTANGFDAPITNVLTGIGDIAGDVATLRIDGVQAVTSANDQGTGNYLAYPLYIGRRAGTSLPFNGQLYSLIVRFGPNLDAAQIDDTEDFVNSKTGAY